MSWTPLYLVFILLPLLGVPAYLSRRKLGEVVFSIRLRRLQIVLFILAGLLLIIPLLYTISGGPDNLRLWFRALLGAIYAIFMSLVFDGVARVGTAGFWYDGFFVNWAEIKDIEYGGNSIAFVLANSKVVRFNIKKGARSELEQAIGLHWPVKGLPEQAK